MPDNAGITAFQSNNSRRLVLTGLLALLTLAGYPAAASSDLKPFEASYNWIWHGMTVAVSTLTLERSNDYWIYRSSSEPRGIGRIFSQRPVQQSVLRVTDAGVLPLSYHADDGTAATSRDANVQFDWDRNHASGIYEDTKVDMPLRPGIQDDLSIQVALMVELLKGRTPDKFSLLDKNTVREYRYTREGEEALSTPLGDVQTIVYRSERPGSPRVTRFWCAPLYGYVPMRVEQKRHDNIEWTLTIQSIERQSEDQSRKNE